MRYKKYTQAILEDACSKSNSLSEVLRRLGANPSGNTRFHVKQKIEEYNISLAHFTYQPRNRSSFKRKRETFLVYNDTKTRTPGYLLKEAMLEQNIEYKCSGVDCELVDGIIWAGKEIPLDVDHIDGNYRNNYIENLRFLCPNCHRLTETFGYKGTPKNTCIDCGQNIKKRSTRCVKCSNTYKVRGNALKEDNYPSTKDLIAGIEEFGYTKYSKTIGLSDNGLRKLLTRRGVIELPSKIKK